MIRLALAILLAAANAAIAATVTVTSGEHEGFTRLVFDYGAVVDWQIGRSADGYELRLAGKTPAYDLRQAFDLIGKSRLAAIWVDPKDGAVKLGLACACHAFPFEFRPGVIVVDLKDGPPPKGSAFELALDGQIAPPLQPTPAPRPRPRPISMVQAPAYEWTAVAYEKLRPNPAAQPSNRPQILPPDPVLSPLRNNLMQEMARGATRGFIEMAVPASGAPAGATAALPMAQIRIGDPPIDVTENLRTAQDDLTAGGAACTPDAALMLADWGDESRPIADQMAEAMAGMTGEFDHANPEAAARAIRFHLFMGFGAEARQLAQAFAPTHPDAAVWQSLSYLLDTAADPASHFNGQAACNGPAALWAVLGNPLLVKGDPIATDAVRLAFSALPVHLRRHLGPVLVDRFLAMEDADTARALNAAILRAPGMAQPEVALIEAEMALHAGDAAGAEAVAQTVLDQSEGSDPTALVALTRARIAQRLPVTAATALALQAVVAESGPDTSDGLRDTATLALAASGNFTAAFAEANHRPSLSADLWALTAELAPDADLLTHGVLPDDTNAPRTDKATAERLASRFLALGLAGPAEAWLNSVPDPDPLLLAKTALARRDGAAALLALGDLDGEEAAALRLQTQELLGNEADRADLLRKSKQEEAAVTALARAGDWTGVAQSSAQVWSAVATRLDDTTFSNPQEPLGQTIGPLAKGAALVVVGAETRAAIATLLAGLPTPSP